MDPYILFTVAHEIALQVSDKIKSEMLLGAYTGELGKGGHRIKFGDEIVERELEKIIPSILEKYYLPGAVVISEERGQRNFGNGQSSQSIFMLIDPIDGSNNMRPHHAALPHLGFSIAIGTMEDLLRDGSWQAVTVGAVRDIFHDQMFTAIKGKGSHVSTMRLESSANADLEEAIIGVSLDRMHERLDDILNAKGLLRLLRATKCQRWIGSAALEGCLTASGNRDAYLSLSGDMQIHDIAAAQLIVREAGGITEFFHEKNNISKEPILRQLYEGGDVGMKKIRFEFVASGNQKMHDQIKKILKIEN